MKTASGLSVVPFPTATPAPSHEDVLAAVGSEARPALARLGAWFEAFPESAYEAKYSPAVGWYEIAVVKRRRAFYFIPKHDDFTLNVILGSRAIMSLAESPHAAGVVRLLKTAKHYPEGTLFSFDRNSFDPDLVIALCDAKLRQH